MWGAAIGDEGFNRSDCTYPSGMVTGLGFKIQLQSSICKPPLTAVSYVMSKALKKCRNEGHGNWSWWRNEDTPVLAGMCRVSTGRRVLLACAKSSVFQGVLMVLAAGLR
eukprot:4914299-Pyramimonas_sp.AAC.1